MSTSGISIQDKLTQVLRHFEGSARYPLFKSMQLGRLMPEGCDVSPTLSASTFEDLMEHAGRGDLGSLITSKAQQEALLHLLVVLAEESDPAAVVGARRVSPDGDLHPTEPSASTYNSVELELELRRLLSEISSHADCDMLRRIRIGDFWDREWSPAPFEEALTVAQLASLDLSVLFRKKGVSDTRIHSLCEALKRIVTSRAPTELFRADSSQGGLHRSQKNQQLAQKIEEFRDNLSVIGISVYELLVRGQQERLYPELHALVDGLLARFSPDECANIVLGKALAPACETQLRGLVAEALPSATRELLLAFLQAPAVRSDSIASLICATLPHPSAFARLVATATVRGLGASPISLDGVTYEGFWTVNPSLIQSYFKQSPSARAENALSLDPILLGLVQAHGKGGVKRKGVRNRLNSRARRGK